MQVTTIGLDLAKNVFHVHGVSATGETVFSKRLGRARLVPFFEALPPCRVGMEACGSAHHWGRTLRALGHDARLMPAGYVKPYVKRGKTDAADAEAICEAVTRPTMRFVPIKSEACQAALAPHRVREMLVRQRTQLGNAIRGLLREFGHVLPSGAGAVLAFAGRRAAAGPRLPDPADGLLDMLCRRLEALQADVAGLTRSIARHARDDADARRLSEVPGIGPITASAVVATVGDARVFGSGRDFAAWLGLTPRVASSGGRERLGRITKQGDRYLRRLLVLGMTARAQSLRLHPERADPWTTRILAQKPFRLATVAMANKAARVIWVLLSRQERYRPARRNEMQEA